MPGKVKVKIIAGRNLPVMDRTNETTDAYVEIKIGDKSYKTDVCRKSLNPVFNDVFKWELDDSELQDEPLQIRLMDYDNFSANDAIGKVNINLNPLLISNTIIDPSVQTSHSGKGSVMSGWIPVFDTMNGIRGEINLIVKVDLFTDVNKFRQSSCGVQFFHSTSIPNGYHASVIHGFVEELVVNDDPEYQWIDKIRTPRSSNEARQVVFLKLSAQVQRRMGLKAIEMGANAVVGYRICLDLEGDVGVVSRGIGTAVTLVKIPEYISQPIAVIDGTLFEENESPSTTNLIASHDQRASSCQPGATTETELAESFSNKAALSPPASGSVILICNKEKTNVHRRSSDSDLSVTPKGGTSITSGDKMFPRTSGNNILLKTVANNFEMLEYPFLTLEKYPTGFIQHLGSCVCARSVKLLERVQNLEEPESRDTWWTELRMEIRSHSRTLGCNAVLGYSETTSISDDVCVLSATGTAALINHQFVTDLSVTNQTDVFTRMTSSLDRGDFEKDGKEKELKQQTKDDGKSTTTATTSPNPGCILCHIPYNNSATPGGVALCTICRHAKVPDVLVSTIEIPDNIPTMGKECLVQAQVYRMKRDLKSESNAKEISDGLPFLEYEVHRLLINKLKMKGMNAIFGLKSSVAIGEKMITLMATGTGVYLTALQAPVLPKIIAAKSWPDPSKVADIKRALSDIVDRNREIFHLKVFSENDSFNKPSSALSESEESDNEQRDYSNLNNGEMLDLTNNNKDTLILEADDIDDLEVISRLMEPPSPTNGFQIVNTQTIPSVEIVQNMQYFVQVWRGKMTSFSQQNHFSKNLQTLQQSILYKLRHRAVSCALCDMKFSIHLPDAEWVQVLITGMMVESGELKSQRKKALQQAAMKSTDSNEDNGGDDEFIFNLDEDQDAKEVPKVQSQPTTPGTNMLQMGRNRSKSPFSEVRLRVNAKPNSDRYGIEISPLCYVPGGKVERYLGNLNFYFIRESTSIRENGGVSGFVHNFLTELLAVVRSHVAALGGNAMISFYLTELLFTDSMHKNQGQSLISCGGDVVFVSYFE